MNLRPGRRFIVAPSGALFLTDGMNIAVAAPLITGAELRRLLQKLPFPAKA
jgi:hypothetical protein